jgi:hypothetical protein
MLYSLTSLASDPILTDVWGALGPGSYTHGFGAPEEPRGEPELALACSGGPKPSRVYSGLLNLA